MSKKQKIQVRKLTQTERNKVMPPGTVVTVFGDIEKGWMQRQGVIERPVYIKDRVKGYEIAFQLPDGTTERDWIELDDIKLDQSLIPEDLEIKSLIPPMELERRKLYDADQFSLALAQQAGQGSSLLSGSLLTQGEVDLDAALRGAQRMEKILDKVERDEIRREEKKKAKAKKTRKKELEAAKPTESVPFSGARAALPQASGKPNTIFSVKVEPARKKNPASMASNAEEAFLLQALQGSQASESQWKDNAPNLIQAMSVLDSVKHSLHPQDAQRLRNGVMEGWRRMNFNAPGFKGALSKALHRAQNPREDISIGPGVLEPLLSGAEPFFVRPQVVSSAGLQNERIDNPTLRVSPFDEIFLNQWYPTTMLASTEDTIFKKMVHKLLEWSKILKSTSDLGQRQDLLQKEYGSSLQAYAEKVTQRSLRDWLLRNQQVVVADMKKPAVSKKSPTYAVFPLPYKDASTMAKMLPIYPLYFVLWSAFVKRNLGKLNPEFRADIFPGQTVKSVLADLCAGVMRAVRKELDAYNVRVSPEFSAQRTQAKNILAPNEAKLSKDFVDDIVGRLDSVFEGSPYNASRENEFVTSALRFTASSPMYYLYAVSFIAHLGMTGGIVTQDRYTNLEKSSFALGGFTLLRLVIESWYRILADKKANTSTARFFLETFSFTSYPYQLQSALFLATRGKLADKGKSQNGIVWLDVPKSIDAMKKSILIALARVARVLDIVPYNRNYELRIRVGGQTISEKAPSRETKFLPAFEMFKRLASKFRRGANLQGKELEIDPRSLQLYDAKQNRSLEWGPGNSLLQATGLVIGGVAVRDPLPMLQKLIDTMKSVIQPLEALYPGREKLKELSAYTYFSNFEHLQRFLLLNMEAQRLVNVKIQKADDELEQANRKDMGVLDRIRAFFTGEPDSDRGAEAKQDTKQPEEELQPEEAEVRTIDEAVDRGRADESPRQSSRDTASRQVGLETEESEFAEEVRTREVEVQVEAPSQEPVGELVEEAEKITEEIFRVPPGKKIADVVPKDSVFVAVPSSKVGKFSVFKGDVRFEQEGEDLLAQPMTYSPPGKPQFEGLLGSRNILWSALMMMPYQDLGLVVQMTGPERMPVIREVSPGAWGRTRDAVLVKPAWYVLALEPETFKQRDAILYSAQPAALRAAQYGSPMSMAEKHGVMIRMVDDPVIPEEGQWSDEARAKIEEAQQRVARAAALQQKAEESRTAQTTEEKREQVQVATEEMQGAVQGPQDLSRVPREDRLALPSFDTKVYVQDALQGRRQGGLTEQGIQTKQARADISMEQWQSQPLENIKRVLNNPAVFTRNTLGGIYRYVLGGCKVTPTQIRKGSYPRKQLIRMIDELLMGRVNQQGIREGGAPPAEANEVAKQHWPDLQNTWSKRVSVGATIMGVPDLIGVPDKGCETPEVFVKEPASTSPSAAPVQKGFELVPVAPGRVENPGKKWDTWDETEYPYLSLDQVMIGLGDNTPPGPSASFLKAYEKAKGVARELAWVAAQDGKIKWHYWEQREKAIKDILGRLDDRKRGGTQVKWWTEKNGREVPTKDHLSLISWAYTPHTRKFVSWIEDQKKRESNPRRSPTLDSMFYSMPPTARREWEREDNPTLDSMFYSNRSRSRRDMREENPTKGEWEKWSDTKFPYLTLEQVDAIEILGKLEGVSEVARSDKGFMGAYRQAHGKPHKLDEVSIKQGKGYKSYWWNRREGFNKRHFAQVKENNEPLWMDGSKYGLETMPTRRHMGLIFWAWSPERDKYLAWIRKNASKLKDLEKRESNPKEMPDRWPTYYIPYPRDPFLMPPTVVVNAIRKMRYITRDHGWPTDVLHEAFRRGWEEWNYMRANCPDQLEEPEPHLYGLRRMRAIKNNKPDPRDVDIYKRGLDFIQRFGQR